MTPPLEIDYTHWTGHVVAFFAMLGSLLGFFPVVAAMAAAVWYMIQIYESDTSQKWISNRRMVRKGRRIAKLRAEQKVLLAELEALEVVREARTVAATKVAKALNEAAQTKVAHQTHEKTACLGEDAGQGKFTVAGELDPSPVTEPPMSTRGR